MNNQIGRVHADEIRQQHSHLDALAERAMSAGTLEDAAERSVELARYFELHAYDEEQFMAEHGYALLEQHRAEHLAVTSEIQAGLQEAGSDLEKLRSALARAVELMTAHRNNSDRRYFNFMKAKGVLPMDAEP